MLHTGESAADNTAEGHVDHPLLRGCAVSSTRLRACNLAPEEHDDMTHLHDDMSRDCGRELRSQFLFLLLELIKLHFHQLVMFERIANSVHKRGTEPILADLEHRLKQLRFRLEGAEFGIGKFVGHRNEYGISSGGCLAKR